MSDFTDFLAAMAIEDSMEDESSSSSHVSRHRPPRTNEPMTLGCWCICGCFVLAVALGVFLESWAWFFGITVFGLIAGFAYDIRRDWKSENKKDDLRNLKI